MKSTEIIITINDSIKVQGTLNIPSGARSVIIFSNGNGSSRLSVRNRHVAGLLNQKKFATLLIDHLTKREDEIYENCFDIDLLTERLVTITIQAHQLPELKKLPVGYFGASTGAASALKAAATLNDLIQAVVCRGGRPDLAKSSLLNVKAPTLLIIGSLDENVLELNKRAYSQLTCEKKIEIVEGATHLFEETGKLDEVADLAIKWFNKHLLKIELKTQAIST